MEKDLIIQSTDEGAEIALLEDKKLVEFQHENFSNNFQVGDIYLGRVKKILPGLNASFVDIGHKKDAFLHYLDLGPNIPTALKYSDLALKNRLNNFDLSKFKFLPETNKRGKIGDVISHNQRLVVQIVKEPISSKGPRLSAEVSIPGRYLILMPFNNSIAISKKITDKEERIRLKNLITSIKPQNYGVIIRTVAEGQSVSVLHQDFSELIEKWKKVFTNLKAGESKLLGELDKTETIIRDILNDSFNSITVDNKELQAQLKTYISKIAPDREKIVRLHNKPEPVFESMNIDRQIKSLFGKTANISGGAYLVIEHTEALHVIDVNSGSKRNSEDGQEENAVKTNIEAATEIARQLRLRDMGGIIVVDFIDMRLAANRKKVYDHMKTVMKNDRAKHTILPISKFGLMQITRQRVKPEVDITTTELCPMCKGKGDVNATIVLTDEIEDRLSYIITEKPAKKISLLLHPYIYAFLTKGIISERLKWMWRYKVWINMYPDNNCHMAQYKFQNEFGEDIIL